MKDIDRAKKEIENGSSLVFVKEGNVLFREKGKGIRPILNAHSSKQDLKDSVVGDSIVGLAHAMISADIGVREIYGEVMSRSARAFLEERGIQTDYRIIVEKVLNQQGDDLCPMEKRAVESDTVEELIEKIHIFFEERGGSR